LLLGNAKEYVRKIYREFDLAGYHVQHWLLDASKMGVPQRRERVFFIAMRKDLAAPFMVQKDMFTVVPELKLEFNEPEIPFEEIADNTDTEIKNNTEVSKYWDLVDYGQSFSTKHEKGHFFGDNKADPKKSLPTICADPNHGAWHYSIKRMLNDIELRKGGSYPMDYDFKGLKNQYLIGMSVPPVMTAQIATEVYNQWINKL
jgi:DNA (cytosine-5)-methyltransferase 1